MRKLSIVAGLAVWAIGAAGAVRTRFETKRPQFSAFVLALAVVAALIVGGASGFLLKSLQGSPAVLAKATTVRPAIDALTGYASGSVDDQRILAFLKQSGYEGGGTVVKGGGSAGCTLLDRNAEREQGGPSPRAGCPGGQIGDAQQLVM